jgi:hypothetical protein
MGESWNLVSSIWPITCGIGFHPLSWSMPCTIHPTNFITNLSNIWGSLMWSHFIHIWSLHLCGDLPWWNNVRFYSKYVRLWDCLLHASLFSNVICSTTLSSIYFPSPFLSLWLPINNHLPGQYPKLFFSLLVSAQYLLPPLSFPPPPPILKWGPKSGQYRGFVVC